MGVQDFIWYEKYRPRNLDELSLPESYRRAFDSYVEKQACPHLLMYGPPGSGKTTVALILVEAVAAARLVLNASSEDRGIGTIKGRVKEFAQSKLSPVALGSGKDLKVVFLDEADYLTPDAQAALRNTIETYSNHCRFVLTANSFGRINPAIRSRTTLFEMSQFPFNLALDLCCTVLEKEEKTYKKEDVEDILDKFYPDMRTVFNALQLGCAGSKSLDPNAVPDMSLDLAEFGRLFDVGDFRGIRDLVSGVWDFGWMYRFLFDDIVGAGKGFNAQARNEAAVTVATYLYQDGFVADKEINFAGCILELMGMAGVEKVLW